MREESMHAPRPLSWSGVPLLPEHLQWSDAYEEDLLASMMEILAPNMWGVSELVIDVSSGVLHVSRIVARLPSGLEIERRRPHEILSRALGPEFDGRATMDVFLGVAQVAPNAPNVTDDPTIRHAPRFVRSDEDGLIPLVRILFDDEELGAERIPIARLERTGSTIAVSKWHLPPMMRVPVGSPLSPRVDAIVDALKARRSKLLDARREGEGRFEYERLPHLELLCGINQALDGLADHHLRRTPELLFRTLARLLGLLEPLAHEQRPRPVYVHEDPGPTFRDILDRLTRLIPTVAGDRHLEIPLQRIDANHFHATAPNPEVLRRRVYLVASGVDVFECHAHLPNQLRIAAVQRIQYLSQHALPGARIAVEFDPPPSLPNGRADACFRIDQRSELWEEIAATGAISMFLLQIPPELRLTLYAVES